MTDTIIKKLLDEGFELAGKAKSLEIANNLSVAKTFYLESISNFIQASKLLPREKENSKSLILANVSDYLDSVERINKMSASEIDSNSINNSLDEEILKCDLLFSELNIADEKSLQECAELYLSILKHKEINKQTIGIYRKRLEFLIETLENKKLGIKSISDSKSIEFKSNISHSDNHLSQKEIKILKSTSNISKHVYLPFIYDADTYNEKFFSKELFSDPDGLLSLSKIQKERFCCWKRPKEIFANVKPKLIYIISAFSIVQTVITDCSFISSLCIAANFERRFKKKLISSIIFPQDRDGNPIYNPSGKYMVKLHLNGIDRKVIIDDRLPVDNTNQLLCSYSSNKAELWVSLLEKAFLKVHNSDYNFLGSNSGIDLHILTGWIPERVSISSSEFDKEKIWLRMLSAMNYGDSLVTASTGESNNINSSNLGLVPSHSYAILRVEQYYNIRLLCLKNPWSHFVWSGKYSALDQDNWTTELKQYLNVEINPNIDNGVFWIDYDSLLTYFSCFYFNWNPDLFHFHFSLHDSWSKDVGPKNERFYLCDNPQYLLERLPQNGAIDDKTFPVWILMSKHVTEHVEDKDYMTIHLYKGKKRIYYPEESIFLTGTYINSPHYLIRLDVKNMDKYVLVVSLYEHIVDIIFTISIFSLAKIRLTELENDCKYTKKIEGLFNPSYGSTNNMTNYLLNPLFRIKFYSNTDNIVLKLLSQKELAIALRLLHCKDDLSNISAMDIANNTINSNSNYRHAFCYLEESKIIAGSYLIIPSSFYYGEKGSFILEICSSTDFILERIR